jgi:hypothetical protein
MDVSTPQGAGAAHGLVYTTKGCALHSPPGAAQCAAPGVVNTTEAYAH